MGKKDVDGQVQDVATDASLASEAPTAGAAESVVENAVNEAAAVEETVDAAGQAALDLRQLKDQLLRQAAEFQNYRRRIDKERALWQQRAQIQVIEPMLAVLDDFRRSLDMLDQQEAPEEPPGPAYTALKEGVELVYQNFSNALEKLGVEYIEAMGLPFDENLHEAMMQMPAPEGTAPGTVVGEIQRGYRLGDRVLRHSRVVVAA